MVRIANEIILVPVALLSAAQQAAQSSHRENMLS